MRSAVWALVAASVLWGTTGTAATFMSAGVSPLAIGACTMAIGGALLFAVSARAARAVIADPLQRRWLILGALGVVIYPLAFYSSMNLAGVAIGNVISLGSGPLFAALLEWRVSKHRPGLIWMLCASLAIAGAALLVVGGHGSASTASDDTVLPGVLLGLAAGAAYALYTFASGLIIRSGHSGRGTMGAVFGLGAIPLAVVLVITGAPLLESWGNIAVAGYLALGPMFLAYVFFGWGLRLIRSSSVTVITLLEPLVATLLAVLIVGERLAPLGWVGLTLILAGVTVLSTARRPRLGA